MTSESTGGSERDQRLNEILAEYIQAAEAGKPLDKEQLLARHAEFADELREFFDDKSRFDRMAEPFETLDVAGPKPVDHRATLPTSDDQPNATATTSPGSGSKIRYFGEYELLEEIARGGMGVVYKARQSTLKRVVALKMILSGQLADKADVRRFYAEAEAAAKLDHPNIVPIFEIGQHEGQHYFSMAYVEGESLAHQVVAGPLPPREAAQLMRKVAEAVAYAHIEGVIHRDLKPANVLMDKDGEPRVTDFGLAKRISAETLTTEAEDAAEDPAANLTATGQVLGTPSYMPPEQAAGKTDQIGPMADVYALGAMLYCLLTGRPPFQAASPLDTLMQVLEKDPVPPRQLDPKIPRDLETICLKCLEKEPRKRYQTAHELVDELRRFQDGEPIRARPISRPARAWRWCRRKPVTAALSASLLLVLLAATVGGSVMAVREAALRRLAEQREAESQALRRLAEQREAESHAHLYASQIKLASQAWEDGEVQRLEEILDSLRPAEERESRGAQPPQRDLRGWEWYYLNSLGRHSALTVEQASAFALSPKGDRLAVGTWSESPRGPIIRVYDVETQEVIASLRGHTEGIWSIAWSPDGRQLASAGRDKSVKIWDCDTNQTICSLVGHKGSVHALAWNPASKIVASGDDEGIVRVWDVAEQSETAQLRHGDGRERVQSLAWRPDGKQLVSAGVSNVKAWDVETWAESSQNAPPRDVTQSINAYCAAWSPDGNRLALSGLGRQGEPVTMIWDRRSNATGGAKRTLYGHRREVLSVAWNRDGTKLVTGGWDKTARIWDAATGRQLMQIRGHRGRVGQVAWTADGNHVIAKGNDLKVWPTTHPQEAVTFRPTSSGTIGNNPQLSWSPDGMKLAVGDHNMVPHVIDSGGATLWTLTGSKRPPVAWSPNGRYIAAAADSAGTTNGVQQIHVWNTESHEVVVTLAGHRGSLRNLCWSPDSQRLASTSIGWQQYHNEEEVFHVESDRVIRIWDVASGGEAVHIDAGPDDYVDCMAWSPSGREIAWGRGERVGVADVSAGLTVRKFSVGAGLRDLAWSPSGKQIAVAFWSKHMLAIFDAASGQQQRELVGHTDAVNAIGWHPSGRRLASASEDGTIRIWDAMTGQELLPLSPTTLQRPNASSVIWSPDGHRLAACQDGAVKIFDATAGQ